MPFTHEQLRPFVEARWITAQRHPTLPLTIYNYSKGCQYERHWTPETMAARGLVLDDDNNVVMRPFPKFFNKGEHDDETMPTGPFRLYEKLDGSLFLATFWNDHIVTATRGTFTSPQAEVGREILGEYGKLLEPGYTYCFELIYPENRTVVDYGDRREIVLLTMIKTETGEEFHPYPFSFEVLMPIHPALLDATLADPSQQQNREGFVLHFHETNQRVKVKFDEYVRMHKIITGINARHIWERLSAGQPLDDILERVPDEFYDWVKATEYELQGQWQRQRELQQYFWDRVIRECTNPRDRKSYAQTVMALVKQEPDLDTACMFRLYDGKPVSDLIWRKVRPDATRPFIEDEAA